MINVHHILLKIIIFIFLINASGFVWAETESNDRPEIGLVLSGGGAKGLAHIGVIKILEEACIKPDYITGTSMGSVIGALYSLGYSSEQLTEITLNADWDALIADEMSRTNLSFEEKEDNGKYAGAFPIQEGKIGLPKGLVSGQNISMLLSRLTFPVHPIEDFSQLPIPFKCVATDIETGEAVVLDSGYLPDVLRASMSIPSMFTPVEINDRLLVDGGVVRNLPASDAKAMGADIIIGVDVTTELYDRKELNSLVKVMEQTINFMSTKEVMNQRKLCDILIIPDMDGYTILSFDDVDSIIARGERAARKMLPELTALADSLRHYPPRREKVISLSPKEYIYITEIEIQGLENVSENLIYGKLNFQPPCFSNLKNLEAAIQRIYGTQYFERVTYKLDPDEDGTRLIIRVIEKNRNYFKFGFRYDSHMKSAILLNLTLRNVGIMGSKFTLDYKLSENPEMESSYFIHTGWRPGFGFGIGVLADEFEIPIYKSNSELMGKFDYKNITPQVTLQTVFSHSSALGIGVKKEFSKISPLIMPEDHPYPDLTIDFLNFFAFFKLDTYDRAIYPRKGIRFLIEANSIKNVNSSVDEIKYTPFDRLMVRYSEVFPVHKNVSIFSGVEAGTIRGEQPTDDYYFYTSGINNRERGLMPFVGIKFLEAGAPHMQVTRAGIQVEPWKDKLIVLRGNIGTGGEEFDDIFSFDNYIYGYGISFGLNTPVGPMELTLMKGSEDEDVLTHVRIGYDF